MKKRIISVVLLIAVLIGGAGVCVTANDIDETDCVRALSSLELLRGDGNDFVGDRVPTRAETLVMLIRLLGLEKEALGAQKKSHFSDAGWAEPYIAYAYEKGLTYGISKDTFGRDMPATSQQYCTFLLRALGYSDDTNGQFEYQNAQTFAALVLGQDVISPRFTRNEMARLSWFALTARNYNSPNTLAKELIQQDIFTQAQFNYAMMLTSKEKQPESTTILIYMIGSDLESLQGRATKDMDEMIAAAENPNIRVVLQTGGTRNWQNDFMIDGKSQRFVLDEKRIKPIGEADFASMTAPETLTSFIDYGKKAYPAERYMLVLWDHGEGTLGGYGRDETNENRTMRLFDIQKGIQASGVRFDIILFDACLMGTMETAYVLKDCADYMIASEDLMPAAGVYYTTWLNALAARPQISTYSLTTLIADSFAMHNVSQPGLQVTMSVVKLDRVKALYQGVLKMLLQANNSQLDSLKQARDALSPMGERDGGYDQFDLVMLAEKTGLALRYEVCALVQSTVVYMRCARPDQTLGLAIYLPRDKADKYQTVRSDLGTCGFDERYLRILDKMN